MNTRTTRLSDPEIQQAIAQSITSRLQEGADALPHDISERLKAARMQALAKRKVVAQSAGAEVVLGSAGQATLQMGSGLRNLWTQLGSWLPLLALVTGMLLISALQDDYRAKELADVDAELLTDTLPPAAYTDPGFAQFLRNNQEK